MGARHIPGLQEWLTSKYAGKLADEGSQDNGDPVEKLTAAFRNKFRMNMYVAVARGVAKQMLECGLGYRNWLWIALF